MFQNNQKSLINGNSSSLFDRFPIRSPDDVMAMPYPLHLAWPWPQRRPASTAGYSCHDVFDGMKPGNLGTAMLQTTRDWDGDDWGMVYYVMPILKPKQWPTSGKNVAWN